MQIGGLMKTTLLDYPGEVASTVFTVGCNFRCPYCHNGDLVLDAANTPLIPIDDIFSHLEKRKNTLGGVCITGGEPTLQPDLYEFIAKIRELGLKVKLDTNGTNPSVVRKLLSDGMLDYVAMDIKHARSKYNEVANQKVVDIAKIDETIDTLMNSRIEYEFRTTVAKELHSREDLVEMAKWIRGACAYYLQPYRESEQVISKEFSTYSKDEFEDIIKSIRPYVLNVSVRALD